MAKAQAIQVQQKKELVSKEEKTIPAKHYIPPADIYETDSGYAIALDLPGIKREALEIDIHDNRLIVKGTRLIDDSRSRRNERPRGKFLRSFTVPASVDQGKIGAEYKDGVLQIRLPKRAEQKAQKIEVKIS